MHVQWWQKRRVVVLWHVGEIGQDNRLRQVTMDIPYEIAFFFKKAPVIMDDYKDLDLLFPLDNLHY